MLIENNTTWTKAGSPYIIDSWVTVESDATLTIEPGVEVRLEQGADLEVRGSLVAVGTAAQRILFTGTTQTPGWWDGLQIRGPSSDHPAQGTLEYVTVEYGGVDGGNVIVSTAQVAISHSILRHSSTDGLYAGSGGSNSTIEASQIVDNANFGIQNTESTTTLLASNNWWGAASGPTTADGCNPGGTGSRVSAGVAFGPFLKEADAEPGLLAPSDARIISMTPQRWFAPANGISRIWVTITLRDGFGKALPGRRVYLQTNLGNVVAGGMTGVEGQTMAYITSATAGNAKLVAVLDAASCEFARSPSAEVTFTNNEAVGDLMANAEAPYMTNGIEVDPEPLTRGVPTTFRAKLTNPNTFSLTIDGTFSFAQSGIGLTFGPIGEVRNRTIPAQGESVVEVQWTPSVSGAYCVQFEYTIQPSVTEASESMRAAPGSGRAQRNLHVSPGPFLDRQDKDAIRKAKIATDAIDDAEFAISMIDDLNWLPVTLIQDQLFENFLDFNFDSWGAASCALGGGENCGGWKGPRLQLPFDTIGNLQEDPPSANYRSIITVDPIPFTPLQPTPNRPATRAAAINALMEESLDMNVKLFAAVVSHDRYAGAAAANDLEWAALQSSAYLHYLQEAAQAMINVGDRFDALLQEIRDEGIADVRITAEAYRDYQARLRTEGFTATEIEAAHLVGLNDEAIENIRQRRLASDPDQVAGSILTRWAGLAAALRAAGQELLSPPAFGVSTGESPGMLSVGVDDGHALVRIYETAATVQVGNPLSETSTIELRVRRLDLPPDWMVRVTPSAVTLPPGEQVTATVSLQPGKLQLCKPRSLASPSRGT